MAYNESIATIISDKLNQKGVEFYEKKMFGGIAFMIAEKMCIGVSKNYIMLRVLNEKFEAQFAKTGVKPMDFTGKPMGGFLFIEESGYEKDSDIDYWIDLAIEFAKFGVLKSKAKKSK